MKKIFFWLCIGVCSLSSMTALGSGNDRDKHNVTLTIPSVALLDLVPTGGSTSFTMAFQAPTGAGLPMTKPGAGSALFLNYSSILPATGVSSRNVTVQVTSGVIPAGTKLAISATPAFPNPAVSGGVLGVVDATAVVVESTNAKSIITGIGSGYTGSGALKGHLLLFDLDFAAGGYSTLRSGSTTVEITYTLQDVP